MASKYKKNIFLYFLSLIPIIISTPPYLGCVFIIILLINLLMILSTTLRFFTNKMTTGNLDNLLILSFMIFFTITFKRILILFSPVLGMLLGLSIYFVPISSLFFELLTKNENYNSGKVFGVNMSYSGIFSLFLFLFFLIREILAFGSISIPVISGIKSFQFLPIYSLFWGTIPGAFVILAVTLFFVIYIDKKLDIVRRKI